MPTTPIFDYSGDKLEPAWAPDLARTNAFKVKAGDYVKGTVCGMVNDTGAMGAYANGNSDGTELAVCICQYDMYSDGTNVSLTNDGALIAGETRRDAPFYIAGFFECAELTGLDANGVTDMKARLIGNLVSGVLALF